MAYEFKTPNHHTFVRVPHQTGCERCGFARGQHPTKRQLASFEKHRERDPHCTCNDCIGWLTDTEAQA